MQRVFGSRNSWCVVQVLFNLSVGVPVYNLFELKQTVVATDRRRGTDNKRRILCQVDQTKWGNERHAAERSGGNSWGSRRRVVLIMSFWFVPSWSSCFALPISEGGLCRSGCIDDVHSMNRWKVGRSLETFLTGPSLVSFFENKQPTSVIKQNMRMKRRTKKWRRIGLEQWK